MSIKKKFRDNEVLKKKLDDAWLNINLDDNVKLFNPLDWPSHLNETPEKYISWLLMRPEYFSLLCSEILNINIIPLQAVILKELWRRKFPMLIQTRGGGKMVYPNHPVLTPNGWTPIKDLNIGDKVYGCDGNKANVTGITGLQKGQDFYKITLRDGRQINACGEHQWKVWYKNYNQRGITNKWSVVTTKKMFDNYYKIRKDSK